LPCEPRALGHEKTPPLQEIPKSSAGACILVLEDEEILRQAAARSIRKHGFNALEASNRSAAIEILRASGEQIDLMLLDMTFPVDSIHEVVREYSRVRPDGKVILTSAYSEDMTRTSVSAPQICGFIRKPFHLAELVKTLRDAISSELA